MRKLLNTLFILSDDVYLSLDGENILVNRDSATIGRFAIHTLESILCFSYKGASPALMGACAKRGVSLAFFSPQGRFLCRVTGEVSGNVLLRREQFRIADDDASSCSIARSFLMGKIWNSRRVLERAGSDYPMRLDADALKASAQSLASIILMLEKSEDSDTLRGLEGIAARHYFDQFNQLILQNKDEFAFSGRNRRPPLDRINALLSFVYTLLSNDCAAALEGVGLDPAVGFLHSDRPGRKSLALDLMEELRPVLADRFALTLVNTRAIKPNQFDLRESGAVYLDDSGRKTVLSAWQDRKRDAITHPFLQEKLSWGLVPHAQALLLSRYLRGDLDNYPPFLWR